MNHFGLFEGIGGFSLAARWMGWKTVGWCEINPFCQTVLKHHFPEAIPHGDIKTTDFRPWAGKIDILTGGFPCQPFSNAGKQLGTEDDRHLWPEMLRAIREIKPLFVVGENVSGFLTWNDGLVFEQTCVDLENEGFEVVSLSLPACGVDAPHIRERVWIVAHPKNNGSRRTSGEGGGTAQGQDSECVEQSSKRSKVWDAASCAGQYGFPTEPKQQKPIGEEQIELGGGNSKTRGIVGDWREFPTQSPVYSRDDGFPYRLDNIAFSEWEKGSLHATGNAVVPQVVYAIFKAIQQSSQSLNAANPK